MFARRYEPALVILGGFFTLGLMACSFVPLQSDTLLRVPPSELAPRVELLEVPFNPQMDYQCGPAALATLMQWGGTAVQADDLTPQVYLPQRKGSLQAELIATARNYDLLPYVIDKELTSLLMEVQDGNPVLVLQNLGLDWLPQWHYAVVVGYDLERDEVVLRSGQYKRHVNTFALFERTWRRANYWGIVIPAHNNIPATATPLRYTAAVSDFEKLAKPEVAQRMYLKAAERWPQDQNILMALGNNYYMLQDWVGAESTFRKVLAITEQYPPALNNLANVLMELGRLTEAEQFALKAIEVAGPFVENYRDTLSDIQHRILDNR